MRLRTISTAALAGATLLVLAACGGDDDGDGGTSDSGEGELTPITLGALPIVPTAGLQYGIDEGIFEEHGFEVTLETGQGGAALIPGLVSGDIDFATSNPLSVMVAQSTGLAIQVTSGFVHAREEGDDITGVYAMPDSGIAAPADLSGRTVAVNNLNTQGDVTIREMVRQDGGDPDAIEFVEIGFPDMPAALDAGNIDAAWVAEPFGTILLGEGAELVGYNYQLVAPGLQTMVVIAAEDQDEQLVEDFHVALEEVLTTAQEDEEGVRAVLPTLLEMDPELADQVLIEEFDTQLDPEPLQILADLAWEGGVVESEIDVEEFIPERAR
ncbi:ABC transporter substrate-binding protein [Georgenia sp. Z1491]|uniref:ABC transporter substrate-binding protein n=1 Tax=Georgenia sp. Z1491 TaxID=3416707 RepID=UPI003CEDF683